MKFLESLIEEIRQLIEENKKLKEALSKIEEKSYHRVNYAAKDYLYNELHAIAVEALHGN